MDDLIKQTIKSHDRKRKIIKALDIFCLVGVVFGLILNLILKACSVDETIRLFIGLGVFIFPIIQGYGLAYSLGMNEGEMYQLAMNIKLVQQTMAGTEKGEPKKQKKATKQNG